MRAIFAGLGLVAMLAGCVPMPPPYGMAPSPPQQAAERQGTGLPEEPEFKPMPRADVRQMRCATLNSASDDDKAYASTFLLGYRSAMVHSHVLDTRQIDAIVQAAVAECAAKPEASAYRVFSVAQIKVAAAEHPPAQHPLRHRMMAVPAAAPAIAPAEPTLSPPLQYVPSPVTPMEQGSPAKAPEEKAATAPAPEKAAAPTPPAETAPAIAKPADATPDSTKPAEPSAAKPAAADAAAPPPSASEAAPSAPKPADSATPSSGGARQ
jgi:hypothetical protein